jgi:hypothetical protein
MVKATRVRRLIYCADDDDASGAIDDGEADGGVSDGAADADDDASGVTTVPGVAGFGGQRARTMG